MQIKRIAGLATGLVCVMAAGHVAASPGGDAKGLNEQIYLLELQVERAELQRRLREAQGGPLGGASSPQPVPQAHQEMNDFGQAAPSATAESSTPSFVAVDGVDGRTRATLLFADGAIDVVRKNEVTRHGWTVEQISTQAVILGREGKSVRVGFNPSAAGAQRQNNQRRF